MQERKSQPKSPEPKELIEAQIRHNGILVEELLKTEVWKEIISPIIDESIASVCGRKTNGRWHHGELTRGKDNLEFLRGYQKAPMDIHNRIIDFVNEKEKLSKRLEMEDVQEKAPIINPFLEDIGEDNGW